MFASHAIKNCKGSNSTGRLFQFLTICDTRKLPYCLTQKLPFCRKGHPACRGSDKTLQCSVWSWNPPSKLPVFHLHVVDDFFSSSSQLPNHHPFAESTDILTSPYTSPCGTYSCLKSTFWKLTYLYLTHPISYTDNISGSDYTRTSHRLPFFSFPSYCTSPFHLHSLCFSGLFPEHMQQKTCWNGSSVKPKFSDTWRNSNRPQIRLKRISNDGLFLILLK